MIVKRWTDTRPSMKLIWIHLQHSMQRYTILQWVFIQHYKFTYTSSMRRHMYITVHAIIQFIRSSIAQAWFVDTNCQHGVCSFCCNILTHLCCKYLLNYKILSMCLSVIEFQRWCLVSSPFVISTPTCEGRQRGRIRWGKEWERKEGGGGRESSIIQMWIM